MTAALQQLLEEGVRDGAFPSVGAVVLRNGQPVFEGTAGHATASSVFDLASLTKILSSATLFARAWGQGALTPEQRLSELLPDSAASSHGVTLEDLLLHRAGFAASAMLWVEALRKEPGLLHQNPSASLRRLVRGRVVEAALRTEPVRPLRQAAVYCDVGFILLGEVLERVSGKPLDQLFDEEVAQRLAVALGYRRLTKVTPDPSVLPTGLTRPRELAPEQQLPPGPDVPSVPTRPGEVDDDNAWTMDGVAGHAGLFGTMHAVAQVGQLYLEELHGAGRIAPEAVWRRMFQKDPLLPTSTRALGFDTPSGQGSSAGKVFGRGGPLGAVGHLGFTGVSLWVDLDRNWVVALLSNRTVLGRHVTKIREFRPRFHDAVAAVLTE